MEVKHKYNHWIPKRLNVAAIILYPYILYATPEGTTLKSTIKHELVHIEQIKTRGVFRFYISYLLFYAAYRVMGYSAHSSYMSIPYEVEAYERQRP